MIKNNISHIAFILDGNKRWAKKNNLHSTKGYEQGFENIKKIVDFASLSEISNITLFTLSSENFNRPSISIIYELIYNKFQKLFDDIISKKNIKVKVFGSRKNLPQKLIKILNKVETETYNNNSMNLNLAFNYGFKEEIKDVLRKYKDKINNLNIEKQNEINDLFMLGNIVDPDILIRTGGYKRLSNFIMYNLTYTELFFTDTLWPDFSINELKKILEEFSNINRKYGL